MDDAKKPLVSVMIPYFNCEQYIAETIASVERQSYPNIEIIIIDDGSLPASAAFLAELLQNKPAIRFASQSNQGVAAARNHAARLAGGEYFVFLDADDVLLPDYIRKSVAVLEKKAEHKLVYPLGEVFGVQTGTWNLPAYEGLAMLLKGNHIPAVAMHRSEDFKNVGGFDESLKTHEDWDLWIRILSRGGEAVRIPQILFRYRKRQNSSSLTDNLAKHGMAVRQSWQKVYLKHSEIFVKHGLGYYDLICNADTKKQKKSKNQLYKLISCFKWQ